MRRPLKFGSVSKIGKKRNLIYQLCYSPLCVVHYGHTEKGQS